MIKTGNFLQSDWAKSISIHLVLGLAFAIWLLASSMTNPKKKILRVEFREIVHQATKPEIKLNSPTVPPKAIPQHRVFGISKNTLTTDKAGAVEVKAGNTIAKEIDNEKIDPKDANSLPIPTEEYLVSQMPRLKNEVRISYPAEAKAKNIEGTVVMDILIDDQGRVRSAKLVEGPEFGLSEAAMKAIYEFAFLPAMMDGKPVAVKIRYAYKFVLN